MSSNESTEKLADGMPVAEYQSKVNTKQLLESGYGYEMLSLFDEARRAYEAIPENDPAREFAERQLIEVDMSQGRMNDAANRGLRLMENTSVSESRLFETALALHQAGRSQEAYDLVMRYVEMFMKDGLYAYALATYAAAIGNVEFALQALLNSYRLTGKYWVKTFLDADLEPVWAAGAGGNLPIQSALVFAHPLFTKVLEVARSHRGVTPITHEMTDMVPDQSRAYLRVHPVTGVYTLNHTTPHDIRGQFLRWQEDYRGRTIQMVQRAVGRAKELVLDHQLGWAVEKAKVGHFLGARNHVLFALGHRPDELHRFAQELRPHGLGYVFDELQYAESTEPGFLATRAKIESLTKEGNPATARDLLDSMPNNLQSLTVSLILRATIEDHRGHRHFATRLWKEIAHRWPDDAVGFGDAIDLLYDAEKWDEARELYLQAPRSYHMLKLADFQRSEWVAREQIRPSLGREKFYGQPFWDERLKMVPVSNEVLPLEAQ